MDSEAGPKDILQDVKCKKAQSLDWAFWLYWEPGGELLSHGICHTTIVAAAFHF